MALTEVRDAQESPWARPLKGTLDELVVESEVLADNPLGDTPRRPLLVYSSPGLRTSGASVPAVYVIQGYGGQADMWTERPPFDPTVIERVDEMFCAGECPDAVVVFVDAWTAVGGSQFLNSSGIGRYMDYLSDEVPAFVDERYPTLAAREHRGLAGKSSGGYGAMVVPMLRPDAWGGLASHAGDALFECCYQREFPTIARQLRDHFDGSYDKLLEAALETPSFDWERFGAGFSLYAYALAYTPDPDRPGKALIPFEISTGKLRDEIWEKWLELDPVRMVSRHADALRSMRRIYLDGGKSDEWFLDLGAQAVSEELSKLGIEHSLELFDGKHGGISYRYPGAIRQLVLALGA